MTRPVLTIPSILNSDEDSILKAVELLNRYEGFTGAHFETLGHRWDDPDTINVVTAADLLALNTLSVQVSAEASIEILGVLGEQFAGLLEQISPDLDLVDANESEIGEDSPAHRLWGLCRADGKSRLTGFGPVTTSKLLARKRPRLLPIYDSVVGAQYGLHSSRGLWLGMHDALRRDGRRLHEHAQLLHEKAKLPETVTPLRVIDIVVWMDGKRQS